MAEHEGWEHLYADRVPEPPDLPVPPNPTAFPVAMFPPPVHPIAPLPAPRPAKSAALAGVLAFFFGPFGMLYGTAVGAAVVFGADVLLLAVQSISTTPLFSLLFMLTWPAGVAWAVWAVERRSRQPLQPPPGRSQGSPPGW